MHYNAIFTGGQEPTMGCSLAIHEYMHEYIHACNNAKLRTTHGVFDEDTAPKRSLQECFIEHIEQRQEDVHLLLGVGVKISAAVEHLEAVNHRRDAVPVSQPRMPLWM